MLLEIVKEKYHILTVLLVFLALAGCAVDPKVPYHHQGVPSLSLEKKRSQYLYTLKNSDIQVIRLGQTLRFVLLSDEAFYPNSANLQPNYRVGLKAIADLMRTYQKEDVAVMAYTDRGTYTRALSLTTRQAQVVSDFLWSHGIDARLTYANGYGRSNLVDTTKNWVASRNNRRVEIFFRFYEDDFEQ